jgi:hypothetical protein
MPLSSNLGIFHQGKPVSIGRKEMISPKLITEVIEGLAIRWIID